MATATMTDYNADKRQDIDVLDPNQYRPISPPTYYMGAGGPTNVVFASPGSEPVCIQNTGGFMTQPAFVSPSQRGSTVLVTQPVVVGSTSPPSTTCALIMSFLSAIACGFWCGAAGILLAWRAKLHVLDRQYEHARHSLRVVWMFVGLACVFGAGIWITVGFYMYVLTSSLGH